MIIPILDIVIQVLVTLALLVLSSSALALEAATPDISIQTFAPNRAESPVGIVRYPDISAKQIVFAYNGELWLVPREGGIAASLTSSAGPQRFPKFSPDGARIAFTGSYDGTYTISIGGGSITRVTHNPGAAQLDKAALIIDERWNEGGYAPFHFVDVLSRQLYLRYYDLRRRAGGGRTPDYIHQGPLCMLINGVSYSGGDLLPYFFRHRGLGKLVGTRTMGGMAGAGAQPSFVDGGVSLVPHVGFYDTKGDWAVEGRGVAPDFQVMDDPAVMVNGPDPQLNYAIQLMLKEIRRHRYVAGPEQPSPARAASPNRVKRFIPR